MQMGLTVEDDVDLSVRVEATEIIGLEGRGERLTLLEVIGRGGMGIIHRGHEADLGRDVAVKVLQPRHHDQPELVGRFVEEARIAGQLQHPGIVPVYKLGVLPDHRPYFVMKLVRGKTLAEILAAASGPAHDRRRLLPTFLQVVQTVAYAHAHGVVHCDLTPSNVMVGEYGEVQVMDWGLARAAPRGAGTGEAVDTVIGAGPAPADPDSNASADGVALGDDRVMGTPGYMAPEQVDGIARPVDARADVFALGSILCQILTGRPACGWDTTLGGPKKDLRPDPSGSLARLGECGADDELIGLVRHCLDPDPSGRPADAGEMAARLTAYLDGVGERLRVAELDRVEAQARSVEERKRRRLAAVLAVLAVALAALATSSYVERLQRREVRRAAAAIVLREAEVLRDEAAADPMGDPARWRAAHDALRRVGPLLSDAPEGTRRHLADLSVAIVRGLRRSESDRRLLDHLELARYRADEGDLAVADAAFQSAFRQAELDIRAMDPAEVGEDLVSRPRGVKEEIIAALDCWAIVGRERADKGHKDAVPWRLPLTAARAADPDPWRNGLRDALETRDRDAIARLALADDIERRPGPSRWLMGRLLIWTGQIQAADDFLTRAWRVDPQDFWINLDLALTLTLDPWQPDMALAHATSAVALRPESAVAHLRLGWIYHYHPYSNRVGAEAEYRTALRLWPEYGRAHVRLARLLFFRSRRTEAAEEFRTAIRLMPVEEADLLWVGLGDSLMRLHRLEAAEVELEEAVRRYPRSIPAWIQVARLRLARRDVSRAKEALDRAGTLVNSGSPEAEQVAKEWARVDWLHRLPALLRGEDQPGDNIERLGVAQLCGEAGLAAQGARLYAEAIAADPKIAEDRVIRPRCYGAFLAAWAGCEVTRDDPRPDADERARLRQQALDWLRGELATWIPVLRGPQSVNRRDAAGALRGWMNTHELAGVRDPGLKALPEDEQKAWQAFWREVEGWLPVDPG
jgi:tetratricopeptide (TPR) repeat protein/tRNA A-37 threonylcarbamoyl transferase component Bud32